jgi:hypothetical protein
VTLEEGFHAWAESQTELAALLGEPNRFRLFKLQVPKNAKMPSSVQQRSGTGRQRRGCTIDGAVEINLQLDHYGKTWQEAVAVAEAFRIALHELQFPVMMGTVKVKDATCENEFDLDDPEPGLYRRSQSWSFWFFEQ